MSSTKGKKKVKASERNWNKIRNEYINSEISMRDIAKKYKIPHGTLAERAKREGWYNDRQKQKAVIRTKTAQKTAEIISNEEAERFVRLLNLTDRIMEAAERALGELDQKAVKRKVTEKTIKDGVDHDTGKKYRIESSQEILDIVVMQAPIDRLGLQQIATTAKAVKDILTATQDTEDTGSLPELLSALKQIGGADE